MGAFAHGAQGAGASVGFALNTDTTQVNAGSSQYGVNAGYVTPTLYSWHLTGGAQSTGFELYTNGSPQTLTLNGGSAQTINTSTANAFIGRNIAGNQWFSGDIAEIVVYDDIATTNERQKIESYLAIKYGFTLSGGMVDYLSASGDVVWNASAAGSVTTGYRNNITGI